MRWIPAFDARAARLAEDDDRIPSPRTERGEGANATFIPAIVWGVAWGALSLALVFFALKWSLVGRVEPAPSTGSTVRTPGAV